MLKTKVKRPICQETKRLWTNSAKTLFEKNCIFFKILCFGFSIQKGYSEYLEK